MDKQNQKTLVIFRDCHKRNNLIIPIEDRNEERFYRNFARRMGWPCCIRKAKVQPAAIAERPRPRLGGAFNLALTSLAMEGGEA